MDRGREPLDFADWFLAGIGLLSILAAGIALAWPGYQVLGVGPGSPAAVRPSLDAAAVLFHLTIALALVTAGGGALLLAARRRLRRRLWKQEAEVAAARREMAGAALRDHATGLPNRSGLAALFDERRALLAERDLVMTLLLVEIERLEQIADVLGHDSADALLVGVAECMRAKLRPDDCLGRLDGGRFLAILLAPRYNRPGEAVARRLQGSTADEPGLRRLGEPVSITVGLTRVSRAATAFSEALRQAELALRAASDEGERGVAAYRSALGHEHDRRRDILQRVTAALEADRVVPVYQPIVALDDRRIVAFEALARLREADGTLVEAGRLWPAFEDPHLSTRISERILGQAILDAGRLRRAGVEFGRVAVNVTEAQIADPDFAERVLDQLMMEGLSPRDLSLELTEDILLSRREARIIETLESLGAAGVDLAFDDFGTGHAAISHLRRYPVGTLKLERSFIDEIAADGPARAISAAVIGMARALDRTVVAEGVETAAVEAVLRDLGCDHVQGFYYSPPVSLNEVERLARSGLAA